MNSMDLVRSFSFLDDELISDAASDVPESGKAGAGGVKSPKPPKRPMSAKVKAIVISACAVVAAAAIVLVILFTTGVFASKQVPIYKGMTISSATTSADTSSSASLASASVYGGDYKGKNDGIDKSDPFGNGSSAYMDAYESTLTVTGSSESIYYANVGDNILITLNFYNPDYYDIISFVLNDGTKDYHFSSYNFTTDSDYENISVLINVGTTPGIINYTISEIKYIDDDVNRDVIIDGDTVVTCGVCSGSMVTAAVSGETTSLTDLSFTVNLTDAYNLISYSGGKAQAILYDGENIIQTKDLSLGTQKVEFTDLTSNTLYQYAVVAYYDDLSGSGAAVNYLYTNSVYTAAVVLFDEVEVGQEEITFGYSWYAGYANNDITKLTLTWDGGSQDLTASDTSVSGLYSNTGYTLTAYYVGTDNQTTSIALTFTTRAKATPTVEIKVTDIGIYSLSYEITYTDTDGVGKITAIGLYSGDTLVQSVTDLTETQLTFTNLTNYTQYALVVSYSYDLNDRNGVIETEESLSEYTDPLVELESLTFMNNSAISENDTIVLQASMNNPDGVTFTSVVINGETYAASALGTKTSLVIEIVYSDQFAGGTTVLTVTQVNCTIGGNSYSVAVSNNNSASVFIYGELTVEEFSVVRYNSTSNEYEQTDYGFASEQLYYRISLSNETGYSIDSITIDSTVYNTSIVYSASDMTISSDYQTIIINLDLTSEPPGAIKDYSLTKIEYSYGTSDFVRTDDISVYYIRLYSDEVVEIYTADDLKNMTIAEEYKYYKLMNDIDLSGYAWVNVNNYMYGVFDGNGHTIKNIGAVTTLNNTSINIGLFTYVQGVVKDITISNMLYIVTLNNTIDGTYDIYAGGIAAQGDSLFISDVNVSASIKVINTNKVQYVGIGGLLGYARSIYKTDNISVEAVLACEFGQTSYVAFGGLYGISYANGGKPITNVTVDLTVDISATGDIQSYVGGLIGTTDLYSGYTISNATIGSVVTVEYNDYYNYYLTLGGVVGYAGDLYGYISFYDVTTETTASVSYDRMNTMNYNAFVNEDNPYIDESCTGTITVTENSGN